MRRHSNSRRSFRPLIAGLLTLLVLATSHATPVRFEKSLDERVVMVKNSLGLFSVELETTLYKPPGDGPFPLVVINHGKTDNPRFQARERFLVASREFVRRGYAVVIPMRSGFSKSTGNYIDGRCNFAGNGYAQAEDVRAAIDFAAALPYVDRSRILVIGQSHGGLTTLAYGAQAHPGVRGLINFAGGLREAGRCVGWEAVLARAFGEIGRKNPLPSLWFYGDNDSYFPRSVVDEMYAHYTAAGGQARFVAFGVFKGDSHALIRDPDGIPIWWPETEKFLAELGLPTTVPPEISARLDAHDSAVPPASGFARIEDVDVVPVSEPDKSRYVRYLALTVPKAFVVTEQGGSYLAYGSGTAMQRALDYCPSDQKCWLYAVDDQVVWQADPEKRIAAPAAETEAAGTIASQAAEAKQ